MKKNIVRFFAVLLACTFMIGVGDASTRASRVISECNGSIVISGRTVTVYFEIKGTSRMDEIGASKITIQRNNGNSWVSVKTFVLTDTTGMSSQNAVSHSGAVSYSAATTGTYRAVVELFATLDQESDSRTLIVS